MSARILYPIRIGIAVSIVAALALLVPVSPASAGLAPTASTLTMRPPGQLLGAGETVRLRFHVTCPWKPALPYPLPGDSTVSVVINQRPAGFMPQGAGSARTVCDGTLHRVDVFVRTLPGELPYRPGDAYADASFLRCDLAGCQTVRDSGVIRLAW
jgi:hypothetical protein